MHILVTNDDGIQAAGLHALAQALRPLGDVTVLAPDRNWSASGHVKTMHRPLRVREVELPDGTPALSSDGAPSDCVALAVLGVLDRPIDMVVSGINPNANLGHDVTYSGTVTAAMEAAIQGLPGIAVSLDTPEGHSGRGHTPAAEVAASVARKVIQDGLPRGLVLNVNVPYGLSAGHARVASPGRGCVCIGTNWCDGWIRAGDPTTGSVENPLPVSPNRIPTSGRCGELHLNHPAAAGSDRRRAAACCACELVI
jgi:5'/3'-nucleotidase SurE